MAISVPAGRMTIDQLAQASGMTVRNIRAHQSRGLVPPPELKGRTGLYTPEHLARVRIIMELQAEGLNLGAIRTILEGVPEGAATEALSLRRSMLTSWEDEAPLTISREELAETFGGADPEVFTLAESQGLVRTLDGDRVEVSSPTLLRVAVELVRGGLPLAEVVRAGDRLAEATDQIARVFVELFENAVWRPFVERGRPAEEWAQVSEILERTRPLAGEATIANLRRSMSRAVEESVARELPA